MSELEKIIELRKQKIRVSGVYKITSPTGRIYIGQSINIPERWYDYKRLKCKRQVKLYNSFIKYGVSAHVFEILKVCSEEQLIIVETEYKIMYKVLEVDSLCCKIDGRGGRHSEETKQKIRESHTGRSLSEQHRISIGKASSGRVCTEETRKKLSKIIKGRKLSEFHKAQISKGKTGTKLTESHRANISKAIKGTGSGSNNSFYGKKHTEHSLNKLRIPVIQCDINGNEIKEWVSMTEAGKIFSLSGICNCCKQRQKTSGGFIWKYKNQQT